MNTYLDCIPCFLKQTIDAARMVTEDRSIHEQVIRSTLKETVDLNYSDPPPIMGWKIHKKIREVTGNPDPYKKVKKECNRVAMILYSEMLKLINESVNPFETAVKLSIAGNIMDFAFLTTVNKSQIKHAIQETLDQQLDLYALGKIQDRIKNANDILYMGDNAGEIVFGKLLIELMGSDKFTYVVKASPIINDATYEDAVETGLTKKVKVIDNGTDAPGTILKLCQNGFKEIFRKADLVISKGQANYETLNETRKNIIFLLKAKCPVIARDIGCKVGEIVAYLR